MATTAPRGSTTMEQPIKDAGATPRPPRRRLVLWLVALGVGVAAAVLLLRP
jgi:hypothetical protein